MMQFYDPATIPKEPRANVLWRMNMLQGAGKDEGLQRDLLDICREDCLFWINAFCWLFEPRAVARLIPFVTWPHQEPLIDGINECIDQSKQPKVQVDFGVEKSRGEGVTWCCLVVAMHRWLFEPMFACGLVSRNEDCVDSKINPDSLMYKIDWQLEQLPPWMRPRGFSPRLHRTMGDHSLLNPEIESTIVGFSATGDVGAGGRKGLFLMDELGRFKKNEDWLALSATQYVTDCRGLLGSYRGEEGAFYQLMKSETGLRKFQMPWWENPTRNRLLYRETTAGTAPVGPTSLAELRDYEHKERELLARLKARGFFGKAGRYRSPWYNQECDRAPSPYHVAEELDMDPGSVKPKLFDGQMLARLRDSVIQPPHKVGELTFDELNYRPKDFVSSPAGRLKLWCPIGPDGRPPRSKYVAGSDLAMGTGGDHSSNSTIVVIDAVSGCQVAEFVTNTMNGTQMAEYVTALAQWFWNALVNFESVGPGGQDFYNRIFGDKLYAYLYWGRNLETKKRNPRPGFYFNKATVKHTFLTDLSAAMSKGDFIPRSEVLLKECPQFEIRNVGAGSKVVHVGEQSSMDEAGKGEAHGDVVIGAAMAWMASRSIQDLWAGKDLRPGENPARELPPDEIPRDSYAGRRKAHQAAIAAEGSWLNFRRDY